MNSDEKYELEDKEAVRIDESRAGHESWMGKLGSNGKVRIPTEHGWQEMTPKQAHKWRNAILYGR